MTTRNKKILSKILESESDTFIIFYKKSCPYCMIALKKLRETNSKYKGYDINKIGGTDILLKVFNEHKNELDFNSSHQTIPIIFYNKKFIGGCDELIKRLDNKS